jgi:hypothetical protein
VRQTILKRLAVYKTKPFTRFARKARISDSALWEAAMFANSGKIDADLGGGVIKQRIARAGEGKSGGTRSIILFRLNRRAIFVFGFEKKDLSNINDAELEAFRELAAVILGYSDLEIAKRVADGALIEIERPKEDENA